MADGLKIVLPFAFTNSAGLDKVPDDKILSDGSLVLIDPIHSIAPWAAGVPADGAAVPNAAWAQAAAILGSGTVSSLANTMVDAHQAADATFERSTKGGLHALYSQTNNAATRGAIVTPATAIKDYLFTNRAHSLYWSVWGRRTRVAITTGGAAPRISSTFITGNPGAYLTSIDATGNLGANTSDSDTTGNNATGNFLRSVRSAGFVTADPANSAAMTVALLMMGNPVPGATAWTNKASSDIFYRFYLEDLTVSGRTYAQVRAIDLALYTEALAVGGKFYGDTFTDPATFP